MHLVDAHRRSCTGARGPRCVSHSASSHSYVDVEDDRRGAPAGPRCAGHRVGLLAPVRRRRRGSRTCSACPSPTPGTNSSQTPDRAERAHRVAAAVPAVEVAGHPHAAGVRRPDRERRAGDHAARCVVAAHVRAEHLPQLLVPALADQVQVELAERRQEAVRVVDDVRVAVVVGDLEPVVGDRSSRAGRRPRRRRARAPAAMRAVVDERPSPRRAHGRRARTVTTPPSPGARRARRAGRGARRADEPVELRSVRTGAVGSQRCGSGAWRVPGWRRCSCGVTAVSRLGRARRWRASGMRTQSGRFRAS